MEIANENGVDTASQLNGSFKTDLAITKYKASRLLKKPWSMSILAFLNEFQKPNMVPPCLMMY